MAYGRVYNFCHSVIQWPVRWIKNSFLPVFCRQEEFISRKAWLIFLVKVSIAATKYHDQKGGWGGKVLSCTSIFVYHQMKSGQEPKTGANGEDMEATAF